VVFIITSQDHKGLVKALVKDYAAEVITHILYQGQIALFWCLQIITYIHIITPLILIRLSAKVTPLTGRPSIPVIVGLPQK